MRVLRNLAIVAFACLPAPAFAFDRCEAMFAEPDELVGVLYERGVYDGSVAHFEAARAIRIETGEAPDGLIPHAGRDAEGWPVIYYPMGFVPVLCRIAIATFIELDSDNWRPFAVAARDAAACVDAGTPRDACLVRFSHDLEAGYRPAFDALDDQARRVAYDLFVSATAQIGVHEFAHHVLEHQRRIADGSLARIDAEFEADFHAVLNAVQIGEPHSAMYYFFKALADIESYSRTLGSRDYESGACRATNVNDIASAIGVAPIVILDAADGGRSRIERNSPELLRALAEELARKAVPAPGEGSCGRISGAVLAGAHAEQVRLASVVAEYGDLLFAPRQDSAAALALDAPQIYTLVARLEAESQRFDHLDGLAAQVISRVIARIRYAGAEAAIAAELDQILTAAASGMLARDYGRLLNVQGLIALHDRARPLAARLPQARLVFEAAATYNPDQSEAWMSLAQIALAEVRCHESAEFARKATRTADPGGARESANGFRTIVEAAIADGTCEAQAASMARILAE